MVAQLVARPVDGRIGHGERIRNESRREAQSQSRSESQSRRGPIDRPQSKASKAGRNKGPRRANKNLEVGRAVVFAARVGAHVPLTWARVHPTITKTTRAPNSNGVFVVFGWFRLRPSDFEGGAWVALADLDGPDTRSIQGAPASIAKRVLVGPLATPTHPHETPGAPIDALPFVARTSDVPQCFRTRDGSASAQSPA